MVIFVMEVAYILPEMNPLYLHSRHQGIGYSLDVGEL